MRDPSASLVCSGLATIRTWPWAGHSQQEKVPGARHRECSQHQSQMPSSIFVYILIFKPCCSTEHSVWVVVQREKLTKNANHISGCCFLSIYRLYFTEFLHTWNSFCYFNVRVQTYKGACSSLKVQSYLHSVCSYCSRCSVLVLWVQQVKEAVEIYCLKQSYKNVGRWFDVRFHFCFSLYTRLRVNTLAWQVHLGILPHRCINPVLSQSGGAAQLFEGRESAHVSGSFSPQRKMASGVDRSRMGRTSHSSPIPPFHTENLPEAKKKKKKN